MPNATRAPRSSPSFLPSRHLAPSFLSLVVSLLPRAPTAYDSSTRSLPPLLYQPRARSARSKQCPRSTTCHLYHLYQPTRYSNSNSNIASLTLLYSSPTRQVSHKQQATLRLLPLSWTLTPSLQSINPPLEHHWVHLNTLSSPNVVVALLHKSWPCWNRRSKPTPCPLNRIALSWLAE